MSCLYSTCSAAAREECSSNHIATRNSTALSTFHLERSSDNRNTDKQDLLARTCLVPATTNATGAKDVHDVSHNILHNRQNLTSSIGQTLPPCEGAGLPD